ncbi:MAG: NADPH-dependent assimilatory sulfite reductase hemoprotein subunit [Ilumatobacter sp.]|jgi:sulfite reductase (ferredoxin)|uniref:NADPH-dependent assimilatory sulfite reductase hemoprotein subunit n=1 Tax=Ilumatobacter sp. TaxID=1967498 RepID=UPI001DDE5E9A|nr:NADPH-dependent assimilatory sulfite reductase hemoprotein subunit [Ilumatobacter sp.]MBT5278010.1 NADPH-dependent assimilatory sulfite reductase hemoprotein subunit [Ilumatobacter sp.]MBT5554692.1 NADPH-dependent assimilatory sulfite reductase hemoprotein subunit [Ilumatobacter sp.]MBT5866290.1 NADPH-dependent assimilatory sulfite reductase hemoprotein subunit [Ilumatobacter sp.]MDG0974866.1 NADPH-dependent assimilatory sulfite reductase hemoprotein subunit [Ilumatobacter sp.]
MTTSTTTTTIASADDVKRTAAEQLKIDSGYLAGTIADELANGETNFEADAETLLKFHGIYQQDDRDIRRSRTQQQLPLDYSCMVRASVPGGVITAAQWLALDRVASLADQKLRLTTRQGVQYHVVHKGELQQLVVGINSSLLTTLGACGDVVRNVMACPLPHPDREAVIAPVVDEMVRRFRPQTETYWEMWVDGERAISSEVHPGHAPIDDVEPVYGEAYLPRKFKIGIAWPGDNCVDIYTHDVGIVPTLSGPDGLTGHVTGFTVLAGGGMGMSHARPDDTYPVLARPIGWVPAASGATDVAALGDVVEAIVTTQRDHGNRDDRALARLKYLLETRGVDWLREQIVARSGRSLGSPTELPVWEVHAHHGWEHGTDHDTDHRSERDALTHTLGLPVPSGKVAGGLRLALRRLISDGTVSSLRVTPRQDLLLVGITDREAVENTLRSNGISLASDQTATRNLAIACPALPTCSKALGEAERVLPDVVDRLEKVLADTGNSGLPLRLNMTGCPNGCSRPYAAELGIVGRSKRGYDIFIGGSPAGDRLARRLHTDVSLAEIPDLLRPLFERYSREVDTDQHMSFGDWAMGSDWDSLVALLPAVTRRRAQTDETAATS